MAQLVPCPYCKSLVTYEKNPHRPFCSERCRKLDLGHWASESYAIPGKSSEVEETNVSSSNSEENTPVDPIKLH